MVLPRFLNVASSRRAPILAAAILLGVSISASAASRTPRSTGAISLQQMQALQSQVQVPRLGPLEGPCMDGANRISGSRITPITRGRGPRKAKSQTSKSTSSAKPAYTANSTTNIGRQK